MLKPVRQGVPSEPHPRGSPRRRRLRRVGMLPTLLTLGNLYFGFAAAYCCGREMHDLGAGRAASDVQTLKSALFETRAPSFLSIAGWMVLAAMICDTLDGRVARRRRESSRFGEQLDSLADIVSFGLAPSLMMVTLAHREMVSEHVAQVAVFVGGIYVCCTGLRLARFTVEATMEEAAHTGFRGLPSPGAAAGVAGLICLHDYLGLPGRWPMTAAAIAWILPLATLVIALLMVSRIPYTHAVSTFLRRRPFEHVILVLLVLPLVVKFTVQVFAVAAWVFVVSGPVRLAWRKMRGPPTPSQTELDQPEEPPQPGLEQQTG